jgi:hypothetical protein
VLDVPLSRPRERNSAEFQKLRAQVLEALHLAETGGAASQNRSAVTSAPSGLTKSVAALV